MIRKRYAGKGKERRTKKESRLHGGIQRKGKVVTNKDKHAKGSRKKKYEEEEEEAAEVVLMAILSTKRIEKKKSNLVRYKDIHTIKGDKKG